MKIDHLQMQRVMSQHSVNNQMQNDVKKEQLKKFEEMLTNKPIEKEEKIETITSWIQAIDQLKQNLELEMTPENLKAYKESVKDFLDYYMKNDVYLKEHLTRDERTYYKSIRVIKVVDQKLDKLIDKLLDSQMGRLELLRKTGEIQGLLLDLTV